MLTYIFSSSYAGLAFLYHPSIHYKKSSSRLTFKYFKMRQSILSIIAVAGIVSAGPVRQNKPDSHACNPAHAYPNGASCVSSNGALTLVTPAPSASFACNPAHAYPNGAQCVSTNGALSLVTPTASASFACNPAHQYPEGVQCVSTNGGLSLVTPTPSASFACNPAHAYPNGAQCVSTHGSLALVTPKPSNY